MNSSIFYLTSIVFSICGFSLLWQLGFKPLLLAEFRDQLFAVRDRLYALAQQGKIRCDSQPYRRLEFFINGTIRYAHRFTFLSFVASQFSEESEPNAPGRRDFSELLFGSLETVTDTAVRRELQLIALEVTTLLPRYIAKSSLAFIVGTVFYLALRSFSKSVALSKEKAIIEFEREAYSDALDQKLAHA